MSRYLLENQRIEQNQFPDFVHNSIFISRDKLTFSRLFDLSIDSVS